MNPAADVELLSAATNTAVVRTVGRRYAGLVVQGDTLGEWVRLAGSDDVEDHRELRAALQDCLRELVAVSQAAGVGVPGGLPPL